MLLKCTKIYTVYYLDFQSKIHCMRGKKNEPQLVLLCLHFFLVLLFGGQFCRLGLVLVLVFLLFFFVCLKIKQLWWDSKALKIYCNHLKLLSTVINRSYWFVVSIKFSNVVSRMQQQWWGGEMLLAFLCFWTPHSAQVGCSLVSPFLAFSFTRPYGPLHGKG